MATEVKIPDLGENVQGGQIVNVFAVQGEMIEIDQPMVELETDKATIEVPCPVGGKVVGVLVKPGDKVTVGQAVLSVDETEVLKEEAKPEPAPKEAAPEEPPKPEPAVAPAEKAPEAPATRSEPEAGLLAPSPDTAPATPSVRRFAREIGIDITKVPGTGEGGRITHDDVKAFSRAQNEARVVATAGSGIPAAALPDFEKWGALERQEMSNVRRKTAEHMAFCWATIPHVTQFDTADITALEDWRKRAAKQVEAAGGKLTVTAVVLKIVGAALKAFPQFNASIDVASNQIVLKKYVHVGIAVATDRGLLVPVIRDVDKKSITELSVELSEVSEKARSRKLGIEDMQGGCFTISNLGGIGGTYFTPIVNWPEVAILGLSRAQVQPVYVDGELKPRLIMPLSLSYDHRVVDGVDGAAFVRWIARALEDPLTILL
ncbi:MAG TPA: 2-oxo acid dehydrogenase subunit E2 [Candidatus Latescibacteria bacterium]|nr:2-oxo acid dehydrogenase subunit E2 [Candidatus Latescibacterota bacterium]